MGPNLFSYFANCSSIDRLFSLGSSRCFDYLLIYFPCIYASYFFDSSSDTLYVMLNDFKLSLFIVLSLFPNNLFFHLLYFSPKFFLLFRLFRPMPYLPSLSFHVIDILFSLRCSFVPLTFFSG